MLQSKTLKGEGGGEGGEEEKEEEGGVWILVKCP